MRIHERAFTLIELVVVIVILAISAMIIYPRIDSPHSDSARLLTSAKKLAMVARHSRDLAISTEMPHVLHLDLERQVYWVTVNSSPGSDARTENALNLARKLEEDIRFDHIEIDGATEWFQGRPSVTFGPEGEVTPGTLSLISAAGETIRLIFNESSVSAGPCEIQRVE